MPFKYLFVYWDISSCYAIAFLYVSIEKVNINEL